MTFSKIIRGWEDRASHGFWCSWSTGWFLGLQLMVISCAGSVAVERDEPWFSWAMQASSVITKSRDRTKPKVDLCSPLPKETLLSFQVSTLIFILLLLGSLPALPLLLPPPHAPPNTYKTPQPYKTRPFRHSTSSHQPPAPKTPLKTKTTEKENRHKRTGKRRIRKTTHHPATPDTPPTTPGSSAVRSLPDFHRHFLPC